MWIHWHLFDCRSAGRSDVDGAPAVREPASVQGPAWKSKTKRWQPLSTETSRCVRETPVQTSHCRAASFLCDCPGPSGGTLEEAEFPGKFRRKLACCRKGSSSSKGIEAWSHNMWLWVFKTVWSGWDSGCEVGGVETAVDLIVWVIWGTGTTEMQLKALISPGFL